MASKQGKSGVIEFAGRGPVSLRVTQVDSTTATLQIGVDYSQAPMQLVHYDADYCDVLATRTGMALIFGKLRPGGNQLRTKVEICLTKEYFTTQIWQSSRGLHKTVRKLCDEEFGTLDPVDSPGDTEKVQSFRANTVFMAVLSSESVLDFFYISPGDIHLAQKNKKSNIALEPVVRVAISTPLLLELLEKCRPFGEQFAMNLKDDDDDNH